MNKRASQPAAMSSFATPVRQWVRRCAVLFGRCAVLLGCLGWIGVNLGPAQQASAQQSINTAQQPDSTAQRYPAQQSIDTVQRMEPLPGDLAGLGVEEHLDAQLPLDAACRASSGAQVELGDLFDGERPLILSLNYSNCPMLCQVQLNGLVDAISQWQWTAGQEFTVVSVSIDPRETPLRAKETQQKYLRAYGRSGAGQGWRFLVGEQAEIDRLASTVGFGYRYLPERNEYVHAAVIMVCTPQGRVSRYLYGVEYDQQTLRLSLVEAAAGEIGSTFDQVLLFCFHYDATKGRYGPAAQNLMKAGGALTMLVLAVALVPFWRRRRARREAVNDVSENGASMPAQGT